MCIAVHLILEQSRTSRDNALVNTSVNRRQLLIMILNFRR